MHKKPKVAIDGPAGAGKSTVAREVAKRLGLQYLDTGAMYRAITLKMIRNNIDLEDPEALLSTLKQTAIRLDDQKKVYLDDEDVTEEIRKPYINEMVSPVSAQSAVRRHLVFRMPIIKFIWMPHLRKERGDVISSSWKKALRLVLKR